MRVQVHMLEYIYYYFDSTHGRKVYLFFNRRTVHKQYFILEIVQLYLN